MPSQLTSIIIVNYNTRDLTENLLKSIYEYCAKDTFEIILVDNASSDGSAWHFRAHFPEAKYIINDINHGFARAVNQGAEIAGGEYLWLLNSDCELTADILPILIEALNRYEDAGIVTPRTVDKNGQFHANCRKFPTYTNLLFSRGSLLDRLPFMRRQSANYTMPDYDTVTKVDSAAGTAILLRKSDFMAVGGFDERFFMYMEDVDMCLRLSQKGKFCYFVPQAVISHLFRGSSTNDPVPRIVYHHRSMLEYFLKWKSLNIPGNILLFVMLTVNMCLQIIVAYAELHRNKPE